MNITRILVIEDEALLAFPLAEMLRGAGFQVVGPAPTLERALKLARDEVVDLALVDINLRDGSKAGIEAAHALLENWGIPSLFLSGSSTEAHNNQDAALGFLDKTYSPRSVLESIAVAQALINGDLLPALPLGLELFKNSGAADA